MTTSRGRIRWVSTLPRCELKMKKIRSAAAGLLDESPAPEGIVEGNGPVYLLPDHGQEALLAARFRLAPFRILIAEQAWTASETSFPRGSWIVTANDGQSAAELDDAIATISHELALDVHSSRTVPDVPHHEADLPRIGLWVPWADTDMMGWIRYVLDRETIPYTYLRDEDLRAGNLRDRVDVIVYGPFSRLDLAGQISGIAATEGPMPFQASEDYPSLGLPVASDDITGGPGYTGLAELQTIHRVRRCAADARRGHDACAGRRSRSQCAARRHKRGVYARIGVARHVHPCRAPHCLRL